MASHTRNGRQHGFTYVSVVILVAIIGLVGAASLRLGSTLQRAAAEQELLNIGTEYANALASYAAATPAGQPNYPPSFKELLRDPRVPQLRRHLRRIYIDPMTGTAEWGIVQATDKGGILAIYSLSKAAPIKIGNFPARFAAFEGKGSIGDWKFVAEGVQLAGAKPGAPNAPGQPAKPGEQMMPAQPGQTVPHGQAPMPPKPGTPQEPPKPEPEPQEPPQEPQEPPAEPPPNEAPQT